MTYKVHPEKPRLRVKRVMILERHKFASKMKNKIVEDFIAYAYKASIERGLQARTVSARKQWISSRVNVIGKHRIIIRLSNVEGLVNEYIGDGSSIASHFGALIETYDCVDTGAWL